MNHGELSWLLGAALHDWRDRVLVVCAGLVPDPDGLSLLGGVNAYGEYHHLFFWSR
ncbi:MAG: hypothetical protein M3Q39_06810 [Actinomycetota bacterium]|nr:hypothetical protein [Actinomycetota bacterium]